MRSESTVATFEWAYTQNPQPALDAIADAALGLPVNWTNVYYAIDTSSGFAWENAGWNGFAAKLHLQLTVGATYYALLRAHNGAGVVSPISVSNGVTVGKMQASILNFNLLDNCLHPTICLLQTPLSQDTGASLAFNTQAISDAPPVLDQNSSAPGVTTGAVFVPPGAVPPNATAVTLVAGVVQPGDVASGQAVDAGDTPVPKPNFHFGNYSFST